MFSCIVMRPTRKHIGFVALGNWILSLLRGNDGIIQVYVRLSMYSFSKNVILCTLIKNVVYPKTRLLMDTVINLFETEKTQNFDETMDQFEKFHVNFIIVALFNLLIMKFACCCVFYYWVTPNNFFSNVIVSQGTFFTVG